MCFSARASFLAAGSLVGMGMTASLLPGHVVSPLIMASTALFSLQQVSEGLIWRDSAVTVAKYAYTAIAYAVWPLFMPVLVLAYEYDPARSQWLRCLLLLAMAYSLLALVQITRLGVVLDRQQRHLEYRIDGIDRVTGNIMLVSYLACTVGPFLLSSQTAWNWVGGLMLGAFAISDYFFKRYVISIWCFLAATLFVSVHLLVNGLPFHTLGDTVRLAWG